MANNNKRNKFVVLVDWMSDLGLSPSELIAYAIIYNYSQDGESSCYATREYFARFMGVSSTRTVDVAINKLVEKGLVSKTTDTVTLSDGRPHPRNYYRAVFPVPGIDDAAPAVPEPTPAVKSESKPKGGKVLSFLARVTEEVCPHKSQEFMDAWTTLCSEPKWRDKTENAIRIQLKKLASVPEVEAVAMINNAIGGGWQGLYDLKPAERNALYGISTDFQARPAGGKTTAAQRNMALFSELANAGLMQL